MRISKNLLFIFQFVTIGLAIAFVAMYLYPELVTGPKPVVELTESTQDHGDATQTGMVSYAAAVKQAAPAVVNIYTTKIITERANPFFSDPFFRRFFGDELGRPRQRQETSLGSGVIVSTQGYVLTNNHVISGAQEIAVAFHDGRTGIAKLVGADPESDLAVLKVDTTDLPAITLGRSNQIRVGDVVLAIGNPFGVGQTVTSGIVSALGRHSKVLIPNEWRPSALTMPEVTV